MSCYIYYYLKKKDISVEDFKVCLAHLCTSDAREMTDNVIEYVAYNEKEDDLYKHYLPLSSDLLNKTINYYNDKVKELETSKARYEQELAESKELYLKANNEVVLNDIKSKIDDAIESIKWCNEEIEHNKYLSIYLENAVKGVLEENNDYELDKGPYEIIYYMG